MAQVSLFWLGSATVLNIVNPITPCAQNWPRRASALVPLVQAASQDAMPARVTWLLVDASCSMVVAGRLTESRPAFRDRAPVAEGLPTVASQMAMVFVVPSVQCWIP